MWPDRKVERVQMAQSRYSIPENISVEKDAIEEVAGAGESAFESFRIGSLDCFSSAITRRLMSSTGDCRR